MSQANRAFFEKNKNAHGSVVFDGVEYAATQNAFLSDDGKTYQAEGISLELLNKAGNHPDFHISCYDPTPTIYWQVINTETDDKSKACNWNEALKVVID